MFWCFGAFGALVPLLLYYFTRIAAAATITYTITVCYSIPVIKIDTHKHHRIHSMWFLSFIASWCGSHIACF